MNFKNVNLQVTGQVVTSDPLSSCKSLVNGKSFWGNIVIVERGDCMFIGMTSQELLFCRCFDDTRILVCRNINNN